MYIMSISFYAFKAELSEKYVYGQFSYVPLIRNIYYSQHLVTCSYAVHNDCKNIHSSQ